MEFKERIYLHRSTLEQHVEVEKLFPLLQQYQAISVEEKAQIEELPTKQAKVGKLLDIVLSKKDGSVLQSFHLVLQKMYQHVLTSMFLEPQLSRGTTQIGSCSTSMTSDSEDDMRTSGPDDSRLSEFGTRVRVTKDIPSHQYDPNNTMSSSFPTFSPLSGSGERQSPGIVVSPLEIPIKASCADRSPSNKDYDWFFKQFEKAFNELQALKQQNLVMKDRHDQVSKEAESMRNKSKFRDQQLQQATVEIGTLKAQQNQLLAEKNQLLDELSGLQKLRQEDKQELSELRHQQRKVAVEGVNEAGLSEMYTAALDKHENMRKDYDILREQYAELVASQGNALTRLETVSEENNGLIGQLEEMRSKNDLLVQERNGLKQQCTNVIREWNQILIKHGQMKEQYWAAIKKRDDYYSDMQQTFGKVGDLKKNCEALRIEKDAAVKEYALVMSERDTVHKEIEQLQDKLSSMSKHIEGVETQKKDMEGEVERLRRELAAVLSERDKYRQERNDISGINQGLMRMEHQREIAMKERQEAFEQIDSLEKSQKERVEELEQVTKEAEGLKKQVEKLRLDYQTAEQEAENANKNRDKAFSERDKIVQERESIRTLCDNLRRDRDRAVSDLAQALRDSDEFKRQKNEAVKELKEIKGRYEAMVEKDSRRHQLHFVGHNHSRDSAIDADLHDLGAETVEIPIEMDGPEYEDLGFNIVGGKDEPVFPNDPSIFVSQVEKGGVADGRLKVNDTILRVNSQDTINVEKRVALQALCSRPRGPIQLLVKRRKSTGTRVWQPIQLAIAFQKGSGISLEQGLYISRMNPTSVVSKYGMMPCVGDRIIGINNIPTEKMTTQEAMKMLESSGDSLLLDVLRQISPLNSAGSSPTPTSTGVNSPLPEGIATSSNMSKSDTLAVRSSSWETPSEASRSAGSSKNLRSSGSQTDSLDSPGPSPRKSLRNQDNDKIKHSLPMLDKAKERMEKMFSKSRHKSQEREKHEDKKEKEDLNIFHRKEHKHIDDSETQANLPSTENVIAQFPNTTVFTNVSVAASNINTNAVVEPRASKSPRKREIEIDSISGTWPKTRSHSSSMSGPPTVMFPPGHKPFKDRPSVKNVFYPNDSLDLNTVVNNNNASNNDSINQRSDSTRYSQNSNYYPQSSQFTPTPTALTLPLHLASSSTPSNNKQQPTSPSSTVTSSSIPTTAKSLTHFSVGVMHGPQVSPIRQNIVPSRAPPTMNKPLSHVYGTSSHKQHPGHRGSLASSHPSHGHHHDTRFDSSTLHTTKATPKITQFRPRRPTSAPHKAENSWQNQASVTWHPHRVSSQSPLHHSVTPPSRNSLQMTTSPTPGPPVLYPGSAWSRRPTSLEVPQGVRLAHDTTAFVDVALDPQSHSLGSELTIGRPPQYHHSHLATISQTQPSTQTPIVSSPSGAFTGIHPDLPEHDRPLSHHGAIIERYSSPSPSQKSVSTLDRFTPTPNEDLYPPRYMRYSPHGPVYADNDTGPTAFTKPNKMLERIRIPSSTSVNQSGSAEIVSDRSSPGSPISFIDVSGSLKYKISPCDEFLSRRKIPSHHETRDISFEKSSKPVGFKIQPGPSGGIFVSGVNDHSLAAQAGLAVGDQLLEVCGINMRNANYEHAATVLRQCTDNLIIKVQYNPDKYTERPDSSSTFMDSSLTTTPTHSSEKSTPKHQISPSRLLIHGSNDFGPDGRRVLTLKKSDPNQIGPGFSFIGGNAVGIFVDEVYHECFVGSSPGLQKGDQILEFNCVDFRCLSAEDAMIELNRPCANMVISVYNNFAKYNKIQTIACDSFYIRTNFERVSPGEGELAFHKDDILYVDNSLYKQQLGMWYAWLIDDQGNKVKAGIIPSRIRLEDEMVLRRSHSESWSLHDSDELRRRGSASARRSFFRRKRHHRNNSKDSHEFGSFSDASLNSDSVPILDDSILGYTPVDKIEAKMVRPVILLAPLAEALINKLVAESPDKYARCKSSPMRASSITMEQSVKEGGLLDYWYDEEVYQCIRASSVQDVCDTNVHCLLNINPSAIDRMHQVKMYPIVIFVRHKNPKQIRETRDSQFIKERSSGKLSKEQFEKFQRLEQDYHHLFSAVVQGGNLAEMCMQIKTVITAEQKKIVWVSGNSYS